MEHGLPPLDTFLHLDRGDVRRAVEAEHREVTARGQPPVPDPGDRPFLDGDRLIVTAGRPRSGAPPRLQCGHVSQGFTSPHQTRSIIVALAMPPPSHIVKSPCCCPSRRNRWTRVVANLAPEAPSGCPSATAPPDGFTHSASAPVSASHAKTTGTNASLTSKVSISPMPSPARSKAFAVAGIGPVRFMIGSEPTTTLDTIRASGVSPYSSTARSEAMTSA